MKRRLHAAFTAIGVKSICSPYSGLIPLRFPQRADRACDQQISQAFGHITETVRGGSAKPVLRNPHRTAAQQNDCIKRSTPSWARTCVPYRPWYRHCLGAGRRDWDLSCDFPTEGHFVPGSPSLPNPYLQENLCQGENQGLAGQTLRQAAANARRATVNWRLPPQSLGADG